LPWGDPGRSGHPSLQAVSPLHKEQEPRMHSGALDALLAALVGGMSMSQSRAAAWELQTQPGQGQEGAVSCSTRHLHSCSEIESLSEHRSLSSTQRTEALPCRGPIPPRGQTPPRPPHQCPEAPRALSCLQAQRPAPRLPTHLPGWQSRSKPSMGHITCSHAFML